MALLTFIENFEILQISESWSDEYFVFLKLFEYFYFYFLVNIHLYSILVPSCLIYFATVNCFSYLGLEMRDLFFEDVECFAFRVNKMKILKPIFHNTNFNVFQKD